MFAFADYIADCLARGDIEEVARVRMIEKRNRECARAIATRRAYR